MRPIHINTSMRLVDCTPATCSEKCEVPTTARQKMSLKAAKFRPPPTHLPRWLWWRHPLTLLIGWLNTRNPGTSGRTANPWTFKCADHACY